MQVCIHMVALSWLTNKQTHTHSLQSNTHPHRNSISFSFHIALVPNSFVYLFYSSFSHPQPTFSWHFVCWTLHNLNVIYNHSALQINKINVKRNNFTFSRRIPHYQLSKITEIKPFPIIILLTKILAKWTKCSYRNGRNRTRADRTTNGIIALTSNTCVRKKKK